MVNRITASSFSPADHFSALTLRPLIGHNFTIVCENVPRLCDCILYGSLCRRRQIGSEGVICVAWWWDGQGFTAGSLGTHPGLVGTKGTHPSIMILSWSDPVTYQPSPTTRAHHLPHPQPDMQVQSASRQFASPLAPLFLFRHQCPGSLPSHAVIQTFQGKGLGIA